MKPLDALVVPAAGAVLVLMLGVLLGIGFSGLLEELREKRRLRRWRRWLT